MAVITRVSSGKNSVDDIKTAAEASVQSFPPGVQSGIWFGTNERGPILPAFGTRECDEALRRIYRAQYNTLVQGAFSGLIKKVLSSPYIIEGPKEEVDYFNTMLQNAQFGEGWKGLISRVLINYLTQNQGAFFEIIGAGDPSEPLTGPVLGLASLDSGRCYVTGQPEYPVLYRSLYTGRLHKMHRSRVLRLVDMPDGEERMYGYGMCALYRCISIIDREIKMSQYVSTQLDDQPNPGMVLVRGTTEDKLERILNVYRKKMLSDAPDVFGRTVFVTSLNQDIPLEMTAFNFSTPPEKFDMKNYTDLDVNALALALGVDKQELWELGGGSLGSGAQSIILAQKARGKAFGDILVTIERCINLFVLPETCEFRFDFRDDEQDSVRSDIDAKYMGMASTMASMTSQEAPVFSIEEIRAFLSNNSITFRKVLAKPTGSTGADDDRGTLPEPKAGSGPTPKPKEGDSSGSDTNNDTQGSGNAPPPFVKKPSTSKALRMALMYKQDKRVHGLRSAYKQRLINNETELLLRAAFKSITETSQDYQEYLQILMRRAFADAKTRSDFGTEGRDYIRDHFRKAFVDGLQDAGSTVQTYDDVDAEDDQILTEEINKERKFWTSLSTEMFGTVLPIRETAREYDALANNAVTPEIKDKYRAIANERFAKFREARDAMFARIEVWVNKGLMRIYEMGKLAAKANQNMAYRLGPTEHCETCYAASQQVHRARDWMRSGVYPKSARLICGGYNCQCYLEATDEPVRGKFSDIPVGD